MPPRVSTVEGGGGPRGPRVALLVSTYNEWITSALAEGAIEAFSRAAERADDPDDWSLERFDVAGAFELPVVAAAAIRSGRYNAVICLGCVIKGETSHDQHLASSVAQALQELATRSDPTVPVAFGVITAENTEQAEARAGGTHGNKGVEAMNAALASLGIVQCMRSSV